MSTLKEIAATYNYFQVDEMPKYLLSNKYFSDNQYVNDTSDVNYYYIETSHILIKSNFSENICVLQNNKGKFNLSLTYAFCNKYNSADSYTRQAALKSLVKPNLIGVFTDRKLVDWFNYCDDYAYILSDCLDVNDKTSESKQTVADFILSMNGKAKVITCGSTTYVDTCLFSVVFSISSNGWLNTKIDTKVDLKDVSLITNILS